MEEAYTWIDKIIQSCNKDFHFDCADILISLFKTKYADVGRVSRLRLLRQNKWNAVHNFNLKDGFVSSLISDKIFKST
jgi:hypothetical protein